MYRRAGQLAAIVISLALGALFPVIAGVIELAWEPVPGAAGYRVYRGTSSGQYQTWQDVGRHTQASIAGLEDCRTWYLAVRAYASNGAVSGFSGEIAGWPRPEMRAANPSVILQGAEGVLEIRGANFKSGAQVSLEVSPSPTDDEGKPLLQLGPIDVVSCERLELPIDLAPAARGFRAMPVGPVTLNVEVVNPDSVFGSESTSFEVALDPTRLDINRSNSTTRDRVDGADLAWLAFAYGSREGEPRYSPDADLDGDGIVDGDDLAFLAAGFGRCWSGSKWLADSCS